MASFSRPSQDALGSLSTCATSCLGSPKQQGPEREAKQDSGHRTLPTSAGPTKLHTALPCSCCLPSRKGQQPGGPSSPDRQQDPAVFALRMEEQLKQHLITTNSTKQGQKALQQHLKRYQTPGAALE